MTFSAECLHVLALLRDKKNVLITAPPSCGKTRLLSEVAAAFKSGAATAATPPKPMMAPGAVAIPAKVLIAAESGPPELPSPAQAEREVFSIVFNASTKPRDFLTALVPKPGTGLAFQVVEGALVRANKHALRPHGAALLLIDEMNRGPAVQLFGGSLVSLEADKRLDTNGKPTQQTWPLEVLDPSSGSTVAMPLSFHLYVLAAMNQADVSIEPLDVAFIRRWEPFQIGPRSTVARTVTGASGKGAALPATPSSAAEVAECAIRAWEFVNSQISIGRGAEFQLGHGVFARGGKPTSVPESLKAAVSWWHSIAAHVEEVFFGDPFGIAAALKADAAAGFYVLESVPFGQDQRQVLRKPEISEGTIYALLKHIAG
jgi:5-methylcytosine-specific restriction enzyme B